MVSQTLEKKTTTDKLETAIVILNWNGKCFLEQFLPSVVKYSDGVRIVIIDNGSTDDSLQFLDTNYPSIPQIVLDKNYGFAEGYNRGLQQVNTEYYILLNSDIEVTPYWWQPLIAHLKKDKSVGAVQPKILAYHDKNSFEYAGACGGYLDKFGYPFCRGRILDTVEKDNGQYDTVSEIFWATGATMAVRADIFHELGGFDSDFFAHMEEIDLCWRMQSHGLNILCEPNTKVFHVGGGTLPNESPFKLYLNFRNNLFMLYKSLPSRELFSVLFIRMCLDGVAGVKYLFSGKWKNTYSVLRAHFSFYKSIGKLRRKRRQIQQFAFSTNDNRYPKNILWQYYVKSKKTFSSLKIQ